MKCIVFVLCSIWVFASKSSIGRTNSLSKPLKNRSWFSNLSEIKNTKDNLKIIEKVMYNLMLAQFDSEGYNFLVGQVLSNDKSLRFARSYKKFVTKLPHCDSSSLNEFSSSQSEIALYPGGPIRKAYGSELTDYVNNQLLSLNSDTNFTHNSVALLSNQARHTVIGIISTILAAVIDIVPPLIPLPVWIWRPFPCLPMLTGKNCLLSVLYPITIADFTIAHVTDTIMDGVITGFPTKYNTKVGITSDALYKMCATVYLGMYCASLFPMCWLPIGLREAQSFAVCFPQCLLVLVACPGFWLDDIQGPCSSVSIPPFCSFSSFINLNLLPPQYTSFEESNPYPQSCPKLPTRKSRLQYKIESPFDEINNKLSTNDLTAISGSLIRKISSYSTISSPIKKINLCQDKNSNCTNCEYTHGYSISNSA